MNLIIPDSLLSAFDLQTSAVLSVMLERYFYFERGKKLEILSDNLDYIYLSVKYISDRLNISDYKVRQSIKKLEEKKVIKIQFKKRLSRTYYHIDFEMLKDKTHSTKQSYLEIYYPQETNTSQLGSKKEEFKLSKKEKKSIETHRKTHQRYDNTTGIEYLKKLNYDSAASSDIEKMFSGYIDKIQAIAKENQVFEKNNKSATSDSFLRERIKILIAGLLVQKIKIQDILKMITYSLKKSDYWSVRIYNIENYFNINPKNGLPFFRLILQQSKTY